MSDFIRMVYGYLSARQIDTSEMEPEDAVKKYRELTKIVYTKKGTFINVQLFAKLPDYEKAKIPEKKITDYALKENTNKALVFDSVLGYNKENAQELIESIYENLGKSDAKEKGDLGYGPRYEVVMSITGPSGKTAKVVTAWMKDKETDEMRLTSVYIIERRKKK